MFIYASVSNYTTVNFHYHVQSIAVLDDSLHLQKVCLDSGIVMVPSLASLAIRQFFCLMHGR
jgi:hypothetical protein